MFTLLFGILLVAVSAVGFGFALFGRRPIPQPAMSAAGSHPTSFVAEPGPSNDATSTQVEATSPGGILPAGALRRMLQREPSADHQPASDVTLSPWVRVRSGLYLVLIVTGLAALIGIITSIVLVGAVLLVT